MSIRNRMTWAGRSASAPPATPGYGKEDQDHPAHTQDDPTYEEYKKGDPSAWAEDPKAPPYAQGNPPSTPGYDTEDQDHPAHKEAPRFPKEAHSLRVAVEKKAAKCLRIARAHLGKKASPQMVEDHALDMMDWSDRRIAAMTEQLGGGFLAQDFGPDEFGMPEDDFPMPVDDGMGLEDEFGMDDGMGDADLDLMLAAEEEGEVEEPKEDIKKEIQAMKRRLAYLMQKANQNDPNGDTLKPKVKDEAAARAEGKVAGDDEDDEEDEEVPEETASRKAARIFFASMDSDRDGFVMADDWTGSPDMFAALDTDNDGILAEEEVVDEMAPKACGGPGIMGLDPEEEAMLAEMEIGGRMAADDDEDDEEEEEEVPAPASKKAKAKKAKKADDDEEEEVEEEDEEEEEEVPPTASKKKACNCAAEEDAGMFSSQGDPMGLAGDSGGDIMASEDDAILAEIFGGKAAADTEEEDEEVPPAAGKKAGDDEEEEEEEEEEEVPPAASKKAMRTASAQRPQMPRKTASGVRTVGGLTRGNDTDELSRLWASSPDVSAVFGIEKKD